MEPEIMITENFKRAWEQLTPQMRNIVTGKIGLLAVNRGHPSLHVHRVRRARDIWICYVTKTVRVLFGVQGSILCLYDLGSHSVEDRVVRSRSFSRPPCFLQLFGKSPGEYL